MTIPFELQIWSAQQCADYLGQSYSQFIKRTQYAEGFPARCPIPGQPRWPAKAVTEWAMGAEAVSDHAAEDWGHEDCSICEEARRQAPALKWTDTPPSEPGRYWFRLSPTDEADVVDVTGYGHAFPTGDETGFKVATIGGQWAGPLKPPEE